MRESGLSFETRMANILVVDDSKSALSLTELFLAEAGHRVTPCLAAANALKVAVETSAELIITDIYMPDKDGLEIIRDARKTCPGIPVLAVSGYNDAEDILFVARRMGAASTLMKPFSREQLLRAVAVAMTPNPVPPSGGTDLA